MSKSYPESVQREMYYTIKLRLPRKTGEALVRLSPVPRSQGRFISELILAADRKSTRAQRKVVPKG